MGFLQKLWMLRELLARTGLDLATVWEMVTEINDAPTLPARLRASKPLYGYLIDGAATYLERSTGAPVTVLASVDIIPPFESELEKDRASLLAWANGCEPGEVTAQAIPIDRLVRLITVAWPLIQAALEMIRAARK